MSENRTQNSPPSIESWRPDNPSTIRAFSGLKTALPQLFPWTNENHWRLERASTYLCLGLFCEIPFDHLPPEQKNFLDSFFSQAMYFNRHLDKTYPQAQKGPASIEFIEDYWCLPERTSDLMSQGERAGYSPEVLETIRDWFTLNSILGWASLELTRHGRINWEEYENFLDNPSRKTSFHKNPFREKKILAIAKRVLKDAPKDDLITQAIRLRCLSSIGFARTLLALATNHCPEPEKSPKDAALLKRAGALVLETQLWDDFGTPVRDARYEIPGIGLVCLEKPELKNDQLIISAQEVGKVMRLARQLTGACVEFLNIDPKHPAKKTIAQAAVLIVGGASVFAMSFEHGGSRYPWPKATWQGVKEIFGKTKRGTNYGPQCREGLNLTQKLFESL